MSIVRCPQCSSERTLTLSVEHDEKHELRDDHRYILYSSTYQMACEDCGYHWEDWDTDKIIEDL